MPAEGSANVVQVWLVELEEAAAALEAEEVRHPRLSDDDLDRIAALAAPQLQRQRRLTAIALRLLIAARLSSDRFDRVPFARTPAGKPELPGAPLSFSLAHSEGRALLAIADGRPLGVDLEAERTLRMAPARQWALMRAAEAVVLPKMRGADLSSGTGEPAPASVLQAWVRLEALAKAEGSGIARVLTAAGVMGRPVQQERYAQQPDVASGGLDDWVAAYSSAGFGVCDLHLPPDTARQPWYGALAAPAVVLGYEAPAVHKLPGDQAALRAFVAGRTTV